MGKRGWARGDRPKARLLHRRHHHLPARPQRFSSCFCAQSHRSARVRARGAAAVGRRGGGAAGGEDLVEHLVLVVLALLVLLARRRVRRRSEPAHETVTPALRGTGPHSTAVTLRVAPAPIGAPGARGGGGPGAAHGVVDARGEETHKGLRDRVDFPAGRVRSGPWQRRVARRGGGRRRGAAGSVGRTAAA
jgi:hypothetical protein